MRDVFFAKVKAILGRDAVQKAYKCLGFLTDEPYLKLIYRLRMGKKLDLRNPRTFNEKLQWLKLHDRRPEYTVMADKYLAKQYIADRISAQYVIPLLGVWRSADEIDFDKLPMAFVLKCNHNSGGVIACRDKSKLDLKQTRKILGKAIKEDYYAYGREWPYKDMPRRIIAEDYLEDAPGECLWDYKFFCFGGKPRVMYMCKEHDIPKARREAFFDMGGRFLELEMDDPRPETPPELPPSFGEMERLAGILSEGVPFLRVDFFYVKGRVYVGELTFFHCGGLAPVKPREWDLRLGSWIELPDFPHSPKHSAASGGSVASGNSAVSSSSAASSGSRVTAVSKPSKEKRL